MKLLINNIEQRQPENKSETEIVLYGRRPENPDERVPVVATGFHPYFYGSEEEVRQREQYLLEQSTVRKIEYDHDGGEAFNGGVLAKIYTRYPQDVRDVRALLDETWAADVQFTNRFLIDTGIKSYVKAPDAAEAGDDEIVVEHTELEPVEPGSSDANPGGNVSETGLQNVEPRVVTLDIEVDDRGDGFPEIGGERILSIVAHDSYTDETVGFIDTNDRNYDEVCDMFGIDKIPEHDALGKMGLDDKIDSMKVEPTERRMLISFRSWFQDIDPDIVTGWNADDFDLPFIIERLDGIRGLSSNVLSPLGWAGESRSGYKIKGRTIYDLLDVYKANSFTELRSYSLDDVAKEELGAEKIEFDGDYFDLYQNDATKFMEYNAVDVELAVEINREADVIPFRDTLRRQVGVDFEDSYNASDFIEMLCRRKLKDWGLVGPTAEYDGSDDYEGAAVFDAYEGVAENVVGIDLASLYPYTMAMLNASPDTKATHEEAESGSGYALASNDQYFDLDERGLFGELVEDAIGLKSDYKEKLQNAQTKEEREKLGRQYMAAKTITNSIYGVTGWERFFLYDKDVAAAVTLTGQRVIKRTAEFVEEGAGLDVSVIYGDTDSCYIKFPDSADKETCIYAAERLCDVLNDSVYPDLASQMGIPPEDNLWEIEVEVYMERFFQAGKKKRYAYLATWKDGHELDEPEMSVSGFSSKRSDSSRLTKETEEEIFDAILHGNEDTVPDIIYDAAEEVMEPESYERIGIPGGMNNKIDPARSGEEGFYAFTSEGYPQDAHPRAVWNTDKIIDGVEIDSSDKPMRLYLEPTAFEEVERQIDVIAFNEDSDLDEIEQRIRVDTQRMINSTIRRPFENICSAINVDVDAAMRGQTQTGLGAFE